MSSYVPSAEVGWLDYSVRDGQRMRELISAFSDRQSIDNLGVGIVRDAISERLFPGISTIQTRARYFLFVPWFCQHLEHQRVSVADFSRRYREVEISLIDRLKDAGETSGVIGMQAGRDIKRLAIEVYWGGLGAYGIRTLEGSISDYARGLAGFYRLLGTSQHDDDGNVVGPVVSLWNTGLPPAPSSLLEGEISLALTEDEATFLIEAIRGNWPDTLVASLAGAQPELFENANLWAVPADRWPEAQRELRRHAHLFSIAVQPARALYNLLLARRSSHVRANLVEERAMAELDQWRIDRTEVGSELDDWVANFDVFWTAVDPNGLIKAPRRGPIAWLIRECHLNADAVETSVAIHDRIVDQERKLKGPLARLSSGRALDTWGGEGFGIGYLDYRWSTARGILADIANGVS